MVAKRNMNRGIIYYASWIIKCYALVVNAVSALEGISAYLNSKICLQHFKK
jgi:hypothetical protein